MNRYRLFFHLFFLLVLCAAGGILLWLCRQFGGFDHPLALPMLLSGTFIVASFLYLFI